MLVRQRGRLYEDLDNLLPAAPPSSRLNLSALRAERVGCDMIEILSAKAYYGPHATGHVVLVDGHPNHFTGKDSRKQAEKFADKLAAIKGEANVY